MNKNVRTTFRITLTAIFMAMNIVMSSFSVPVPGGHLYLNDAVICVAALLLNPIEAFVVGGIGAFLGDFFFYPTPMFVSLITHGLQAVVISLFSHYVLKKQPLASSIIAVIIGALIMVGGYTFGRAFIYGTVEAAIAKLPYQFLQAGVGAAASIIICFPMQLRKIFNKYLDRNEIRNA